MNHSLEAKPVSQGVFFALVAVFALSLAFSYRHNLNRGFSDSDDFGGTFMARQFVEHPENLLLGAKDAGFGYRPLAFAYLTLSVSWLRANPNLLLARNFILFLVCIWLVFSIANRLSSNRLLSLGASALFAFHPANVNVVSVAIFGYMPFCAVALLVVRLLIPVATEEVGHSARCLTIAWVSWLLATLLPFGVETFLWLLPVQALLFFWVFRRTRSRTYLVLAALCLAALFGHVLLRYLLSGAKLLTLSSGARYGLKTPLAFLANLVSLYANFGSIADPVLFFNPVDQALPRSVTGLMHMPSVVASLILSALVSASVLLASLVVWRQGRNNDAVRTGAPLVLVLLSFCSVSVVSAGGIASETYLFTGNALWSIAAVLLVGGLLSRVRVKASSAIATAGIVALAIVVISLRVAGTVNRNRLLADKAKRIAFLQSELRAAAGDFRGKDLYLVPDSQFPKGYSIYGGRSLSMISVPTFACVTLNRYDMAVHKVAIESLPSQCLTTSDEHRVLIVDIEGNVRELFDEARQCDPDSSTRRLGSRVNRSEYIPLGKRVDIEDRR
ncbi:MAG: hypothetical protein NTX53_06030 [candidate division WOR-3 bacterium]|nr:hypothetical protein [candidate division WOR-3 bacterium]